MLKVRRFELRFLAAGTLRDSLRRCMAARRARGVNMGDTLRRLVLGTFDRLGFELRRSRNARSINGIKHQLFRTGAIDLVLDVGANAGDYALQLRRELGFGGGLVSFEPLASAFAALQALAGADPRWQAHHCALGEADGTATINIAGNSYSSSLLPMLPAHVAALPVSTIVATETIRVRRLDDFRSELPPHVKPILLKIDAQGFEAQVLRGAAATLADVGFVEIELSLVPLYSGQALFAELAQTLRDAGFLLIAIEPAFTDGRTGELLQVDGLFKRHLT